jgi:type 1 glutamine amidotransferase
MAALSDPHAGTPQLRPLCRALVSALVLCSAALATPAQSPRPATPTQPPRVLFLTHTAGFEHEVVKRPSPTELSYAESLLPRLLGPAWVVDSTKDCHRINASELADTRVVVFHTTGELPIPETGKQAFFDWIERGGGFVGLHCATDTLYQCSQYMELVGAAFDGHPWHQQVSVRAFDEPPVAFLRGATFSIFDEIYQFRAQPTGVRLCLELDMSSVDAGRGKHAANAIAWWKPVGKGRMVYNALGHGREAWDAPVFHELLREHIRFAAGAHAPLCVDGALADPAQAAFFALAALSRADDGKLWGTTLDGPMIVVDPNTRVAVANRSDAKGALQQVMPGLWTAKLPAELQIANTALEWNGTLWTMLLAPLPEDPRERDVLVVHESFHRLQKHNELEFESSPCAHLDERDGRTWLRLEMRALARALERGAGLRAAVHGGADANEPAADAAGKGAAGANPKNENAAGRDANSANGAGGRGNGADGANASGSGGQPPSASSSPARPTSDGTPKLDDAVRELRSEEVRLAFRDALLFRAVRRDRNPKAGAPENGLELHEGLAEATGLALAYVDPAERLATAARALREREGGESLVRGFAYATGPAYALALDVVAPARGSTSVDGWRAKALAGESLGRLAFEALGIQVGAEFPSSPSARLALAEQRRVAYGHEEIDAQETARETTRRARIAADRARYADGVRVVLSAGPNNSYSFDPNRVRPLAGVGTIYEPVSVTDDWGVLEASGGALQDAEMRWVVPAPTAAASAGGGAARSGADRADPGVAGAGGGAGAEAARAGRVEGPGWVLELGPDWRLALDAASRTWRVERAR